MSDRARNRYVALLGEFVSRQEEEHQREKLALEFGDTASPDDTVIMAAEGNADDTVVLKPDDAPIKEKPPQETALERAFEYFGL